MANLPQTAPPEMPIARLRRSRLARRVGLVLVVAFVAAGALGVFGIRTGTVSASGAGYAMSLEYPATDRSNQPIHWVLSLRRPGGFPGPVRIGISQSYLDILDLNDVEPQPSDTSLLGGLLVWTFDPPAGDVLRVVLDADIQQNAHFASAATVALVEHGRPILAVRYRTWVAP